MHSQDVLILILQIGILYQLCNVKKFNKLSKLEIDILARIFL